MKPRNLEIGPGNGGRSTLGSDWDSLDVLGNPTFRHDITVLPYPVEPGSYQVVYASHVLEHAPWHQTVEILREWARIARDSVEVCVPDFAKVVKAYLQPEIIPSKHPWWRCNPRRNPKLWVNGVVFTYGPEPNFHKALFDEQHLRESMLEAGLKRPELIASPRTKNHGWINLGMRGFVR